jgi:RNA polymerase sigma factor (sigma-70 family)
MDRFTFDDDYVRRLREHDARTEEHFNGYFEPRLFNRLRKHVRSIDDANDLRQDTFTRVLTMVYQDKVREAGALFGLVMSVCDRVLFEHYRDRGRTDQLGDDDDLTYEVDYLIDLITRETQLRVRRVLKELSRKDQKILRAIFIHEMSREEVCRKFRITSANLRVLLHRALKRFREKYPPDDETK